MPITMEIPISLADVFCMRVYRLLSSIKLPYGQAQIWESNPILKGYEPCNLTVCPICDTRCFKCMHPLRLHRKSF